MPKKTAKTAAEPGAGTAEQIGFHKGSLSTLAKEREELARMLGVVEQLMHMHIKALKELGVDLQQQAQNQKKSSKKLEESV